MATGQSNERARSLRDGGVNCNERGVHDQVQAAMTRTRGSSGARQLRTSSVTAGPPEESRCKNVPVTPPPGLIAWADGDRGAHRRPGRRARRRVYGQAFGAVEVSRIPVPDDRLMSVQLRIGDGVLHVADEFPDLGVLAPARAFG